VEEKFEYQPQYCSRLGKRTTADRKYIIQGTKSNLALAELVYQIIKIKDIQNEYDPDESVNSAKSDLNHTSYTYRLLHENT
jgi:hypothetical protein